MRAVFLDFGTVSNGDLDPGPLERALPGIVIHERTPQADVPGRIAGFEAVLANKSVIDGATIRANPSLKLVALTATGVDNVDLAAAREAGVAVCNLRDYCTPSVAQHVFALLLALTHRVADYQALVAQRAMAGSRAVLGVPVSDPGVAQPRARHRRLRHARQGGGHHRARLRHAGRDRQPAGRRRRKEGATSTTCCRSSTCSRCTARSPRRRAGSSVAIGSRA